jgi:hypothetical protein
VPESERGFANNDRARASALAGAQHHAEVLCSGFGATTLYRLTPAEPETEEWECSKLCSGMSCGFEGKAVRQLEVKDTKEEEPCVNEQWVVCGCRNSSSAHDKQATQELP